ncbi:MAG: sugar ABC transporter permease [Thermoflexales bacterium]|nr:sugar ABC transporter permease [Thermoflexales bacterium]
MRRLTTDRITAFLLLVPSIVAIAVFVYGFIGWTGYTSLSKWNSLKPDFTFVGLYNYQRLFANDRFQIDIRNTVFFTLFFLSACLVLGFGLAVLLDQRIKGEGFFRSIFLFPMSISFIVTGVVWRWLLNPSTGINLLVQGLGFKDFKPGWYTDPTILFISPDSELGVTLGNLGLGALTTDKVGISIGIISLVIAATWQMSGYTMAMYLAGLRGIPEELREAARVDGASEWQVYQRIILPLLQPITLSAVIILGHISLKIFDLVSAMTGPGPAFSTDVPAYFMFDTTFRGNHFSQGAAIAIVLLVGVAVLVIPYLVYTRRMEVEQ